MFFLPIGHDGQRAGGQALALAHPDCGLRRHVDFLPAETEPAEQADAAPLGRSGILEFQISDSRNHSGRNHPVKGPLEIGRARIAELIFAGRNFRNVAQDRSIHEGQGDVGRSQSGEINMHGIGEGELEDCPAGGIGPHGIL
jgi:hypothetical protein